MQAVLGKRLRPASGETFSLARAIPHTLPHRDSFVTSADPDIIVPAQLELRPPSLLQALLPLAILIALLATGVGLFGDEATYGANQISLLLAGGVAAAVGIRNGLRWSDFEAAIAHSVSLSTSALLILLMVGAVIGSWMLSGTVPTLIYYGLQWLSPAAFYPASMLICGVVGLAIGSSWTVAGTIGVALMGVAAGLGLNPAIAAGAIISGAYFGDKLSPLSDTTNLAPAVAGSDLFAHVRHMLWTTLPAYALALLIFTGIGLRQAVSDAQIDATGAYVTAIGAQFKLGVHLLLPVLLVLVMAMRRVPALPTLAAGAASGLLMAVLFQPAQVHAMGAAENPAWASLIGLWKVLYAGYNGASGNVQLDELLNRGGMISMLNTVWLILCAMMFGACMEKAGLLQRLVAGLLARVQSAGTLVAMTVLTAFGVNVIASDQYISIVLPGRIYRLEYARHGLDPVNLSRACEDGGTLTSVLVPWNTCGAYISGTLGVATLSYLPYAFFNWLSPLIAISMALAGFKLLRSKDDKTVTQTA